MTLLNWLRPQSKTNTRRPAPGRPFTLRAELLEDRSQPSAGALDPSFNGSGSLLTSVQSSATETTPEHADAVEVLGDGSVLTAGGSGLGADVFGLVKIRPNGTLDPAFGSGGRVATNLYSTDSPADLAVQPDGKIVVVGYTNNMTSGKGTATYYNYEVVVLRYNPNGTPDTTFGGGTGRVVQNVSPYTSGTSGDTNNRFDQAFAVALQPDGKILVGGATYTGPGTGEDSLLLRYNPDGTLDSAFGGGGKVVVSLVAAGSSDQVSNLIVRPDGTILARGRQGSPGNYVARFGPNGALDPTFGTGGVTTVSVKNSRDGGTDTVVDPADGGIYVFGGVGSYPYADIAVVRLTAGGQPDADFGTGGTAVIARDGDWVVSAVARQADGKLVAVGEAKYPSGVEDALVVRINPDGSPDSGFGVGGFAINSFSPYAAYDAFYDVAIQADGRIVAAGGATASSSNKGNDNDFLVARFLGDPPAVSVAGVSVAEGGTGGRTALTFTVSLSWASSQPVTVYYKTLDGTATAGSDYEYTEGSLTFTPGQTQKTVTVWVLGDTAVEADETFSLALSAAPDWLNEIGRATGTITNDD